MRLRVLTLNCWDLPFGLAHRASARLNAVGEALSGLDADIVALQEVWTPRGRRQLLAAGAAAGYAHRWHREEALGGSGLLVMSRLPIARTSFVRFRLAGLPQRVQHADYYGGKGLALLTLETGDGPLALAVTHLHADYVAREAHDEYLGVRAAQVVQIAHALLPIDTPLIAAGDWNTQEGDDEYAALLGLSGLADIAVTLDARQDTIQAGHPYQGARSRGERIDMILTRDGRDRLARPLALRRVLDGPIRIGGDEERASDHAGLLAEIEIEPRAAAPRPDRQVLHTPDPDALVLAAGLLDAGLAQAAHRRTRLRWGTAAGFGSSALGASLGRRRTRERRDFLGALLLGLAGLGFGAGVGAGWLAEGFGRSELAGFAEARRELEALGHVARADAKVGTP